jgi:aspartyl-tRNA(Asn)/glutamyl-tRNA(Gln) amidotransferase subunit A
MAMASSLDQIGPIAKTVEDTEIIFDAIAGRDQNDSTSKEYQGQSLPQRKKRLGVPYNFLSDGVDGEVRKNFDKTMENFKKAGYEVIDLNMSLLKYSLACYYIIMPAEASTNLARFDGIRYGDLKEGADMIDDYFKTRGAGFGKEVRRRIMLGTYVLSAGYYDTYYDKAIKVRNLIKKLYIEAFEKVDAILTPTAPTVAFKLGEKISNPLQMYLEDVFTVPANLAGIPAISVPTGLNSENLPLGIQIAGPHFGEKILFELGKEVENFK